MRLDGKEVAAQLKSKLEEDILAWKERGVDPRLVVVRVGERPDDLAYENRVRNNCFSVGMQMESREVDPEISEADFLRVISQLNKDSQVHGIMVLRPLPKQLTTDAVNRSIDPRKDIDCMNPENLSKLFAGDPTAIPPCTSQAALTILKHYEMPLKGKHLVVINRSMVIGKPLAMLALSEDATVTICHSKTEGLAELCRRADYVVTGVGKARRFGLEYFSAHSVVVDCGINFDENGKMCGDVDFTAVEPSVKAITPVPGGVGAVTSALLLCHVLDGLRLQEEEKK